MELTVCDVARDDDGVLVIVEAGVDTELFSLRLATRCAVVAGRAVICIGGMAAAGMAFFGSVDESV